MTIVENISDWQEIRKKIEKTKLGFVPTMGALHAGHIALVRQARRENELLAVSIFVNPAQFNDPTDLERYPRDIPHDLEMLRREGTDYVFIPNADEMYADHYRFKVMENDFSKELCGRDRPGHFDGVLTVVLKLFSLIAAQRAYFGEKDYQQLLLIRDMVKYFFLPIDIVPVPIVRDSDGIALSSRNTLLGYEGRKLAAVFARILKDSISPEQAISDMEAAGIAVDYVVDRYGPPPGSCPYCQCQTDR